MAVGKTSVGKRVAKVLGIPFIDTDSRIAQAYGSITEFFANRGEAEFRRIEAEIVKREVSEPGARVISLGGGAVLTASTRELLRDYPTVLLMSTERAVLKTANLSRRPLLRDDPRAWSRILESRRHLYEKVADVTFRTDQATKDQVTNMVVGWIEELPGMSRAGREAQAAAEASKTAVTTAGQPEKNQRPRKPRRSRRRRGRRQRNSRGDTGGNTPHSS